MALTRAIEVMKYVKASAGRANLNVAWEDVNQPRHDGNTIYLPTITRHTTDDQLNDLMASVDHEVAHDLYSDFDLLKEKNISMDSPLGLIWNLIEDSRVNSLEADLYRGFQELWDSEGSKQLDKIAATPSKSDIRTLLSAMFKWDATSNRGRFPSSAASATAIKPHKDLYSKLQPFTDRLEECRVIEDKRSGSTASYELAKDIFRALGGDPEKEEEQAKASKKETGDEGDPSDKAAGEKVDETSASKDAEGDADGKEPSDEWTIVDVKMDHETLKEFANDAHRMSKTGTRHDTLTGTCSTAWTMTPFEDFTVVDYSRGTGPSDLIDVPTRYTRTFIDGYHTKIAGKVQAPENFANDVRRLIQVHSRDRYEFGVKRGKLDQSRLARVCLKDAAGFNERVFKRKIINNTLDSAISVLVDMSGSMSGEKVLQAFEATKLLNHVCQVLNVSVEITGFSDLYNRGAVSPLMFLYKSFDTPRVTQEALMEYFAKSSPFMAGNPDGENILWAYDRLLKRKEKRRILIVMSDGQPAATKCLEGIDFFTKDVIEEIERNKLVDIYGLGLLSPAVTKYYKQHSVVTKASDIPTTLIQLIEQKILGI